MIDVDIGQVCERVDAALTRAGAEPWLLGFDANAIQEFVTANGRPIAMRGASAVIRRFDAGLLRDPATIFAGGGRALQVVPAGEHERRLAERVADFRTATHGGVLAAAAVRYDPADPAASLAWLRVRLAAAKDEAPRPDFDLPASRAEQCADCGARRATRRSPKPDALPEERICNRCFEVVRLGREEQPAEERLTLQDPQLVRRGRIAVVSADGNNLGAFFGQLDSLHALAVGSVLVAAVFEAAHRAALPAGPDGRPVKHVAPVTGGDDIRVFLSPADLLDYVEGLGRALDAGASEAARCATILPERAREALGRLSVGVGAVIADAHLPAFRLVELARSLERSAKTAARRSGGSTFDFALLTAGSELTEGLPGRAGERTRPVELPRLPEARRRADALRRVPRSQRAWLLEGAAGAMEEAEYLNLFRYQVARHDAWQRWFRLCGVEWRDPAAVAAHRPDRGLLELAALLDLSA